MIDICPKCVGVALDPGELRKFKAIRHTPATRAMDVFDTASGLEMLGDILKLIC
jgi:Zn-finger nucleic acid-binding protein